MIASLLPSFVGDEEYDRLFKDPSFGLEAARALCRAHGIDGEPRRLVAGTNLLFRVAPDRWLKIYPDLFDGEHATETWMLEHVAGRLGVPTPEIIARGKEEWWAWSFISHVDGIGYDNAKEAIPLDDRARIAGDLGRAFAALHELPSDGFERPDLDWAPFLRERIATASERARTSGADERWTELVASFMREHADELLGQSDRVLAHADLYFDHLLVSDASGRWEISGIIDFADTIIAPREFDFVDPLLWLFRGEQHSIAALLDGAGHAPPDERFAHRMLAWSLVNRFTRFADAYKAELALAGSMEELAEMVFVG